ncbi:hypothetical protein [Xanthocytophaga flava]|uniref:hypothetical protein n=1 Tax=Xanthocytophaga flava TaxID=3048013 RepID=UPI0028D40544|nr:hypothetical protein [Xanthocytophaga flavus]MDJ1470391.1 hypothetical protein [Xanthocytophaga flavus]
MAVYTKGIAFEKLETVLKIYKKQARSQSEVLSLFSQDTHRKTIEDTYEKLVPLTIAEALLLSNAEQRMVALQCFGVEELVTKLNAKQLDAQTITKKQIRWDEHLKPYEHTYEDTYELYKIDAKSLGIERHFWREPAIYFVKCQCASTDRLYYLYVSEDIAQQQDAIAAIAWTMRFNGKPLTKQQYLNLMYSET